LPDSNATWPGKKTDEVKPPEAPSQEALLAKMAELLSPIQTSINEQNTRLSAIEESRNKKPEVVPGDPTSIFEDEGKAFTERLGPLAVETVLMRAKMAQNEILGEYSDWQEFFPQIKTELSNAPVSVKADAAGWERYVRNVADMVIGREGRKSGLKRNNNSFVLETGGGAGDQSGASSASQEDKDWLNFHVTTGKGKVVTRAEFLKRMGTDISDPAVLAAAKKSWSTLQVVN
jgi:hypothetical protein